MNYAEVRKQVCQIIPGTRVLFEQKRKAEAVKEKGRKSNYFQYDILNKKWEKRERLLNAEEINSFVEISMRAAACPMPFNIDVWDGLVCPYNCVYCYANAFRASLYTSFFDNSRSIGIRHCNPDFYKRELDKMQGLRGKDPHQYQDTRKAFAMEIPLRLGIRFEDFLKNEKRHGISWELLRYLKETEYPVMINTKSDLVGEDKYVRVLAENPAKAAVHITLLTPNDKINRELEPGAPSYKARMKAAKKLASAGVRVVMRIEPFLFLINDREEEVQQYIADMKDAGIKHITFDTYSYTALNPGLRQNFINEGYDFDRMFIAGCDGQYFGSYLLKKYMAEYEKAGISCSTFDMGNVPANAQDICCEVGDWFKDSGWNYGSSVMAARYIVKQEGKPVAWKEYYEWVMNKGGFLSPRLKQEMHELWNMEGNTAFGIQWAQGLITIGWDEGGFIWTYKKEVDEREKIFVSLKIKGD